MRARVASSPARSPPAGLSPRSGGCTGTWQTEALPSPGLSVPHGFCSPNHHAPQARRWPPQSQPLSPALSSTPTLTRVARDRDCAPRLPPLRHQSPVALSPASSNSSSRSSSDGHAGLRGAPGARLARCLRALVPAETVFICVAGDLESKLPNRVPGDGKLCVSGAAQRLPGPAPAPPRPRPRPRPARVLSTPAVQLGSCGSSRRGWSSE